MTAVPILNLALPKATKLTCELCGLPARFTCQETPVAFCTLDHFHQDWKAIRHLLIEETKILRSLTVTAAVKARVRTTSLAEARKWIVQSDFPSAVAAALQALKISVSLYSDEAVELVDCYLLLAEGNLGLGRLKDAETFLSLAQSTLTKKQDLSLMSKLQRNLGKLFVTQNKPTQALKAFASDVYYCTMNFGVEAFETAPAFFNLGRVFLAGLGNQPAATRCFQKALEIFLLHGRGRPAIEVQEALAVVRCIRSEIAYDKQVHADVEAALAVLLNAKEHAEMALLLYAEADLHPGHHKVLRLKTTVGISMPIHH